MNINGISSSSPAAQNMQLVPVNLCTTFDNEAYSKWLICRTAFEFIKALKQRKIVRCLTYSPFLYSPNPYILPVDYPKFKQEPISEGCYALELTHKSVKQHSYQQNAHVSHYRTDRQRLSLSEKLLLGFLSPKEYYKQTNCSYYESYGYAPPAEDSSNTEGFNHACPQVNSTSSGNTLYLDEFDSLFFDQYCSRPTSRRIPIGTTDEFP